MWARTIAGVTSTVAASARAGHRMWLFALVAAALVLGGVVGPIPSAQAESSAPPVRLLVLTSGLIWTDIDARQTPALERLAEQGGVAAMNTTSATERSTQRQGTESVHTGYRGLAKEARRSSGIPTPPQDRLADIPGGVTSLDARSTVDPDALHEALAGDDGLVIVDAGTVAPSGADHRRTLAALDARVETIMAAASGSDGQQPRTILASVAPFAGTDAADSRRIESGHSPVPAHDALQAVIDTGYPGQALTSGATHQSGIIVLTDIAPTLLASHGVDVPASLPGQPIAGVDVPDPQRLALDRTLAASDVIDGEAIALGAWLLPTGLAALALLIPAIARRPHLAAVLRALGSVAPLALAVGLFAGAVPWWRSAHPTLALVGVVVGGSAVIAALVLSGPWRRHRFGPAGVCAAVVAAGILLESATGSHFQVASPLGAQPITGGRYYGLSNHLFGMVLAASLMALCCLFTVVTSPRARVTATLVSGSAVAAVCVAPSMGADFGSMLVTLPIFGLLALLVAGIRLRVWHVLALGIGGVVVVLGVSYLDWLRPPADRTHLGRFIEDLISGNLLTVIVRKLSQNIGMATGYVGLGIIVLLAIALSVLVLAPRRFHLQRLAALDAEHPVAHRVRMVLVAGGWMGYAVNDTGPVLIAAMLGIWLCLLPVVLPDPAPARVR